MSEHFPEDLGAGIPPIRGKSMRELFELYRELEATGTNFDDLVEGQNFNYLHGNLRFSVTVLGGQRISKFHHQERPLVSVKLVAEDGEVLESSGGMLLGVSLTGDGNFPILFLPPEGSEYVPFVIETLPSPDEPEVSKILVLKANPHFE